MHTQTISQTATLTKKALASYSIIDRVGKTIIAATGQNTRYVNPKLALASDTYSHSYLVNFRAVEARKAQDVLTAFAGADSVPFSAVNKLLYCHEVIVNKGQAEPNLPAKGEEVTVVLSHAMRDGSPYLDLNGKRVLNVTSMQVAAAVRAATFGAAVAAASDDDAE